MIKMFLINKKITIKLFREAWISDFVLSSLSCITLQVSRLIRVRSNFPVGHIRGYHHKEEVETIDGVVVKPLTTALTTYY